MLCYSLITNINKIQLAKKLISAISKRDFFNVERVFRGFKKWAGVQEKNLIEYSFI